MPKSKRKLTSKRTWCVRTSRRLILAILILAAAPAYAQVPRYVIGRNPYYASQFDQHQTYHPFNPLAHMPPQREYGVALPGIHRTPCLTCR
jgi:hypothetical protein